MYSYNKKLVSNAQELRKNMTDEERHLWYDFLKKLPIPVKRQKSIGNYILDFYIPSAKLAIEIDGRQHKFPEHFEQDRIRDEFLNGLGIAVVRYSNDDIRNRFQAVAKDILTRLGLGFEDLGKRVEDHFPSGNVRFIGYSSVAFGATFPHKGRLM